MLSLVKVISLKHVNNDKSQLPSEIVFVLVATTQFCLNHQCWPGIQIEFRSFRRSSAIRKTNGTKDVEECGRGGQSTSPAPLRLSICVWSAFDQFRMAEMTPIGILFYRSHDRTNRKYGSVSMPGVNTLNRANNSLTCRP